MRRSLSLRKAAGITHLHSRPPPPRTLCAPSPTQLLPHLYPSPFTPASTYPSAPSTLTRPLLLTSLLTDWPALQSWTRENAFGELREASEGVKVEVELGRVRRGYLDKEWKRVEMGLSLFLDAFMLDRIPPQSSNPTPISAFCAQQDLFEKIPSLSSLAPILPHALPPNTPRDQFYRRNVWIGRRTFSPIHKDPYGNLYCQVFGQKRIHLFPPYLSSNLYLSNHPLHLNTSTIPISSPPIPSSSYPPDSISKEPEPIDPENDSTRTQLFTTYPLLLPALLDTETRYLILNPGETLFIPEGWWHSVESVGEEGEVSVNHWFR